MLDINFIRENPTEVKKNLERRKNPEYLKWFKDLLKQDSDWRKLKGLVDQLRHDRNKLSEQVNQLMKAGKKADAAKIILLAKKIPPKIDAAEKKMKVVRQKVDYYLMRLPNMMHESVPYGADDSENAEIRTWGKPRKDDWIKPHGEIAEGLGANFDKSSKVAGAGFYYLSGDLALLNQALIQFAISKMVKNGFTYVETPLMLRQGIYAGVVDLGDFEDVMYKIEGDNLFLIATSEHSLISQYAKETLHPKELPIALTSYSMCFRKEVGTHSVDEKGLFRTHQFNKVEMVVLCKPEESWDWHEKMIGFSEDIFKDLGIPHRVVNICTGDLGTIASKKYDLETWSPREKKYKEVGSCSNCTDYQARRLKLKFQEKGGDTFVHTLNNTAIATSRTLVAILENFQNKDGSVDVPKPLQKYMGKKKITPK